MRVSIKEIYPAYATFLAQVRSADIASIISRPPKGEEERSDLRLKINEYNMVALPIPSAGTWERPARHDFN